MAKKGDKHFTKDDEQFLIENFDKLNYEELAVKLNRSVAGLYNKCRRLGLIKKLGRTRYGALNANWKGGTSNAGGYVKDNASGRHVHRLTFEKSLGRTLESSELIHHIDGVKHNNNLENLHLCKNASHHRLLHASLEKAAFELVQKGVIIFDKASETYVVNFEMLKQNAEASKSNTRQSF